MNIIYIEPFYSGAHKQWIDSYKEKSSYNIKILSLVGVHWKWRMHGAAISLAKKFLNTKGSFDLIIVSDMLNLPLFKSLCQKKIKNTKIVTYFHENQISYPRSINDKDKQLNRDLHYAFINYSTALVSDYNLFNSFYHLTDFIEGLESYLKKMPDKKNLETIKYIQEKSEVLHIVEYDVFCIAYSCGLVLDDDYVNGVAKSIANDLSILSGKKIYTMGF